MKHLIAIFALFQVLMMLPDGSSYIADRYGDVTIVQPLSPKSAPPVESGGGFIYDTRTGGMSIVTPIAPGMYHTYDIHRPAGRGTYRGWGQSD
jgi:hypothetical protein